MADELDNPLFDSVFADLDKQPTPFKAEAPSLLDETIDEVGRQSAVPAKIAAMKARDANPDQYQQIKTLSEKVGLDSGFVERNMPELKRQQVARDISEIADKSPALGMWFAQDDNPAAIKVDELRHLSGLEWLVASGIQSFKGGREQVEFGALSNKVLRGVATPEELARADEIFDGRQPRTYGADGWLEQAWVTAGEQVPNMANYAVSSLEGFVAGFTGGAVAGGGAALVGGQLGPQAATPEEVITVPAAALATGIWTGRAGALSAAYLTSFEQTAGPAFYEFKNMTDENGQKMDEDTARVAAYVVGAIGGGLEVIGTEKIASLVPGADKVTGLFTKDAVKAALMQPTVRQALKDFAVGVSEAGLTEVSTEVAQEAVQVFAGEMAKLYANSADGTSFEGADAGAIADQLIQAADQTAKAMTILGPVLGSTRLGMDLKRSRRASADKAILDAVAEHAQNDELVKRLPEKAQSAIEALTADGPVQSVYIQPEGIRTLFQTAEEVDAFIDAVGIRDEWNEASAIGRDVQIPFATYYAKIAATEAQQALAPFTKLSVDAMTPLDADMFNEAWNEAKDNLLAEMDQRIAQEREILTGVEKIADDVKAKVMNAGVVPDQAEQYSKLYAAFFRTMGERMGLAPDEIYGRYGFDVQRALPGGEYKPVSALDVSLSAVRSGRIPSIRKRVEKAKGKSLLERIRERGGIEDVKGEISATGLKGRQYVRKQRTPDMIGGAENANTPDAVVNQLWQEGYFPEFQDRPDPNVLYDAIREELGGQKRYSATLPQSSEIAELGGLVAFADMLDELGIDPNQMTDDEVRTALEAATNADATSGALFQGGDKRGSIQIAEGRTVINLFDQVNLSTFLHESGHFFLEVFKDLAQQGGDGRRISGALPAKNLAPANVGNDGVIYVGKPGGVHFEIEAPDGVEFADVGFVTPDGQFLDRQQAFDWVEAQGGKVKPSDNMGGGLDALDYREQVPVAHETQAVNPLAADWQALKDFLGITGDTIPVEAHEKFARSFEAYLFEGKTPSEDVAGIFARFRSWLVFVYKQVQRLNAPINDKIRGVMDRLIATDEEIKAVGTAPEFRSAFKDAADAGMTDAQWEAYQAQVAKAREQATRTMDARLMGEVARETTAEWREAKRKLRDEVTAEMRGEPVYRAMNYLRTGEWDEYSDDGVKLPAPVERLFLDRDAIVSIMGEGALERMPRSVPPMYRAKGGVSPDFLAELFGFQSGHDMLTRMMSVPSLPRAVAAEVDVRMKERFGDLMGDAVARAREAQEAITNDATGEVLEAELEVLVRKGFMATSIRRADARRAAKAAIRQKPIREALRQKLYMNANAKAAQEAERAILAKDWPAAVKAKQRQLVNHYMALEAVEAKRDVESAVNYLGRFTGRKRPTTVDPEYLDQIETLLERFDFRKSVTLTQAQRRLSLAAFIEQQEAAGNIVQIPDTLRDDAFRKPYKSMTVEDLLGLQDTVKNIEHLGRLKNRLLSNKEAREFASARDEVIAAIAASQDEKAPAKTRNPTVLDEGLSLLKSLDASLLKIEQVLAWMDGDDVNGPLSRMIFRPIAEAEARENDLQAKYSAKFVTTLQKLDPKRLNEWVSFNGVKYQRSNILAVALNMGNEGNFDKMKRGEVWTDADVQTLVSNLNAEEWQAVQEIWDTINELWPQISALQKRLTGVEPLKVEAREVATPYGTLKGGYYPLIYDPNKSADVEDRAAANADKLFENTYLRPDTWHGFTKERTTAYARPISFDINGAGAHLIAVIHDLTHREAIMDANKLLTNADVRMEIENRYGKEIYRQFIPWLQSIAHDRSPNDGLSAVNRVFRGIRSRATMVGMGFRISTIITQVVGYSSSAEMVPVRRLAGAVKDFIRSPFAMSEEVNRLSGEMRFRSANLDRDIRDQIRQQTGQKTLLEQARKFAFVGIGYADRVVTVPTWMAAYQDHLSRLPTDKEGAVAHADKVVRMTGGSGGAKDLAAITRGKNEAAKLITMFYSYFSAYYNRQRNWGRAAKRAIENGTYSDFPSLLAQQVFMTVIPAVAAKLIVGDGPDDEQTYAEWAAKQIAMYPLSAVPIVRDVAGTFDKGFGYSFTPAGRAVDEAAIQPFKIIGDMIDGEAEAREVVVQALQTTGYALKLPTGQLATSTNNVWKAIEEDDFQLRDLVLTRKQ